MLVARFCQNFIEKTLPTIHKKRRKSLNTQVVSLLGGASLTLTSLGRHLQGTAKVKHKINMTWRFLSNHGVYNDSLTIYKNITSAFLPKRASISIGVDWSGCCGNKTYLLRASFLYQGRSIPIYNEVHPVEELDNNEVHITFLDNLYQLIPAGTQVSIVTDAGFKTPWFHKVAQLGWYFIGRVRGTIHCKLDAQKEWVAVKMLHKKIKRGKTAYLGTGLLGKTSKTKQAAHFIGHFSIAKKRKKPKRYIKSHLQERKLASGNKEPWILVTNWDKKEKFAEEARFAIKIASLYKKRMQIEQNFRDDKNQRFGFAWRYSRTTDIIKISILCLIAAIATLILWFIGFFAEKQSLQYDFQANTVKKHRVLSFIFLGMQIIKHSPHILRKKSLFKCFSLFQHDYDSHMRDILLTDRL